MSLNLIFKKSTFILTDKGKAVIEKNDHLIYFHRNRHLEFNLYDAIKIKKTNPNLSNFQIVEKCIFEKINLAIKSGNWYSLGANIYHLAQLNDDPQKKLKYLFQLFYLDYFEDTEFAGIEYRAYHIKDELIKLKLSNNEIEDLFKVAIAELGIPRKRPYKKAYDKLAELL